MSSSAEDRCTICGSSRGEHPFRHQFVGPNDDGQLKLPPEPKPKPNSEPMKIHLPASEGLLIGLLKVLTRKGLLDGNDVAEILTGQRSEPDTGG